MTALEPAKSESARLWVCHPCRMIGDNAAAERHVELKGHRVEQLDQETSDAVREEWAKRDATMFDPAIAAARTIRRHGEALRRLADG